MFLSSSFCDAGFVFYKQISLIERMRTTMNGLNLSIVSLPLCSLIFDFIRVSRNRECHELFAVDQSVGLFMCVPIRERSLWIVSSYGIKTPKHYNCSTWCCLLISVYFTRVAYCILTSRNLNIRFWARELYSLRLRSEKFSTPCHCYI